MYLFIIGGKFRPISGIAFLSGSAAMALYFFSIAWSSAIARSYSCIALEPVNVGTGAFSFLSFSTLSCFFGSGAGFGVFATLVGLVAGSPVRDALYSSPYVAQAFLI